MHRPPGMPNDMPRDPGTSSTSSPAASSDAPREPGGMPVSSRALQFARRHPALTVVGAGGAALIGGIELALGVLIGAGISTLVRMRGPARDGLGHEAETETHEERVRTAPSAGPAPGKAAEPEAHAAPEAHVETGTPEVREAQHRARELLQRAPEVVRRRARAVVQAARGKLAPGAG